MYHPRIYWIGRYVHVILEKLNLLTFLDDRFPLDLNGKDYPYPARLSNILSKIGVMQLNKINSNLKYREALSIKINNVLKIYTEDYIKQDENVFLRYSFLVDNRGYWEKEFSSVINLGIWFKTVIEGMENNALEILGYASGQNENSEYCAKHIFNIPTHSNIDFNKIEKLLIRLKESGDILTKERVL